VPLRFDHAAGGGGEPQALRSGDRLSLRVAHVGSDLDSSSTPALRRARRGLFLRRCLGAAPARRVLPPQAGTQRGFPREVSRWIENSVPAEEAFLRGLAKLAGGAALLRALSAHSAPPSLGGRCPQTVRRTGAGVALSGALHPPRGHLQSPTDPSGGGQGHLPLE